MSEFEFDLNEADKALDTIDRLESCLYAEDDDLYVAWVNTRDALDALKDALDEVHRVLKARTP